MDVLTRHNVTVGGDPNGQPMVFAHGFGCDQSMWADVAAAFPDFKTVLYDLVGSGNSEITAYKKNRYSDLAGHADDVVELCRALELSDVVFVGHSVSGMIGVLAVKKDPDLFDKLVLVGPSPRYVNDGDYDGGFSEDDIKSLLESLDANYFGWSSTMAPVIMGSPDRPELGQRLTESFCRTDPYIAKHFARVTFLSDNRDDLPDVQAPTLVMQCSDDPIAPTHVGEYVRDAIPDSRIAYLAATGHCPNVSAPGEVIAVMREFV